MAAQNYQTIFDRIMKHEGGLSTRTAATGDPGGRTYKGFTQGFYDAWRRSQGLPQQDTLLSTPEERDTMFRNEIWNKIGGDSLPTGLDYALTDLAFNSNPARSVKILQRSLGLAEDGVFGPDTAAAFGNSDPAELLGRFTATRRAWQLALPNADQNPGWVTRINNTHQEAAAAIRNGGFGDQPTWMAPRAGQDGFGDGFNTSTEAGPGILNFDGVPGLKGPIETGNPYTFGVGGSDFAGRLGTFNDFGGGAAGTGGTFPSPWRDFSGSVPGLDVAQGPASFTGAFAGDVMGTGLGRIGDASRILNLAPPAWFNEAEYKKQNSDVSASGMGGWEHYARFGFGEGRAIDTLGNRFGSQAYLAMRPDVAKAGMSPLEHYLTNGMREGQAAPIVSADGMTALLDPKQVTALTPYSGFNADTYLNLNQDVRASGMDGLQHAITYGAKEGRTIDNAGHTLANVDWSRYAAENPDVMAATMNPVEHFLKWGGSEGRTLHTMDEAPVQGIADLTPTQAARLSQWGLSVNPEYVQTQGAPAATPTIGAPGLTPTQGPSGFSGLFDGAQYLKANSDVAASGMDPMQHYLQYGQKEGRALNLDGVKFDNNAYLAANPDVALAGMNPFEHFANFGSKEGRQAEFSAPGGVAFESSFSPGVGAGADGWGSILAKSPVSGAASGGVGAGVSGAGSMNLGGSTPAASGGSNVSNPFGFTGMNAGVFGQPAKSNFAPNNGPMPDSALFNPAGAEANYLLGQNQGQNAQIAANNAFSQGAAGGGFFVPQWSQPQAASLASAGNHSQIADEQMAYFNQQTAALTPVIQSTNKAPTYVPQAASYGGIIPVNGLGWK